MATKRDLVEAYSFSRRRLVTAFVSGAPGGREVEPTRPGRMIVGGVALGVLMMAGAALTGVFAHRPPEDWQQQGLVVSEDTGQAYVITGDDTLLHPVINITSARLIVGSSKPAQVPDDEIKKRQIGDDIGILGAPSNVPDPGDLVQTGWSACTAPGSGIKVDVSRSPGVTTPAGIGFVVRDKGTAWLIATAPQAVGGPVRGYRYRLPSDRRGEQSNVLNGVLTQGKVAPVDVPVEWLTLFPQGGDLDFASFGIPAGDLGTPVSYAADLPGASNPRVGDLVQVGDEAFVLTHAQPVKLTPFAAAVYASSQLPGGRGLPRTLQATQMNRQFLSTPGRTTTWPTGTVTDVATDLCARLTATAGDPPTVVPATTPDDDASAQGLAGGVHETTVDPGAGAYVTSGSWSDTSGSQRFLVDLKGQSHYLEGAAATNLGYGDVDPPLVPDSWLKLFEPGVVLSPDQARCPPSPKPGQGCA